MKSSTKLFRDPVHGNIHVEKWICDSFVDTDVFQRLRFIEQSSVRLLFPGARHDRFIHSIGVYHIAVKIFEVLSHSFKDAGFGEQQVESMRKCYVVAALLHDCAHSPFSHTGECLAKDYCNAEIERLLITEICSASFENDLKDANGKHKLHTHEMASAYVGARTFAGEFEKYGIDREQFARMITGILNGSESVEKDKMAYNCLIRLLNGFVIDADRLDYLLRDTWATGLCNTSVDIDRLIAGLELEIDRGWVRLRAKALSSVVNAITARDYIFTWILPHHKVALANLLLSESMKALVKALSDASKNIQTCKAMEEAEVGSLLFSPERLLPNDKAEVAGERVSLISDGDVLYLMKKYIPDDIFVRAYMSREKTFISLWKSYAEFSHIFTTSNDSDKGCLQDEDFWTLLRSQMHKNGLGERFVATKILKIKQTVDDLHKVDVVGPDKQDGEPLVRYDLCRLIPQDGSRRFYFYVYIFDKDSAVASHVIHTLKNLFEETLTSYRHLKG